MPSNTEPCIKSSGVTLTKSALLALALSRLCSLMPFVTIVPSSLAEAITVPPGHMQKV